MTDGTLRARLRPSSAIGRVFPAIEDELGPYRHLFTGRVLNAGAGNRDISHLIDGELVNQDVPHGAHNANIDIWSSLEAIPVEDGHFDAVVCNAVLEHVADPEAVMAELSRVLRAGGTLYLGVPFMQPVHHDPIDCQRYTEEGLRQICARHGFSVQEITVPHSVEATFAWMVQEWLRDERRIGALVGGRVVYELLSRRAVRSQRRVVGVASALRVIATRD